MPAGARAISGKSAGYCETAEDETSWSRRGAPRTFAEPAKGRGLRYGGNQNRHVDDRVVQQSVSAEANPYLERTPASLRRMQGSHE
jgi:hypothetical protein